MDLDSALDDIIKRRSHSISSKPRTAGGSTAARHTKQQSGQQRHQHTPFRRSVPFHSQQQQQDTTRRLNQQYNQNPFRVSKLSASSSKPPVSHRPSTSILQRIGPVRGGGSTSRPAPPSIGGALSHRLGNQRKKQEVDPSQIVITKAVHSGESAVAAAATTATATAKQQTQQSFLSASLSHSSPAQKPSLSIRGLSSGGLSIRGEGGPARVLISNLDPGANAEDVKAACSAFGTVLHCEVLTDHSGRSYGEAEVEFSGKQAALDCIEKLDNEIADGRVIRAILRSGPRVQHPPPPLPPQHHSSPMHNFATQTLRSVIAPTRPGYTTTAPPPQPSSTGKLYSDQLLAPEQQLAGYARYVPQPPPSSQWY